MNLQSVPRSSYECRGRLQLAVFQVRHETSVARSLEMGPVVHVRRRLVLRGRDVLTHEFPGSRFPGEIAGERQHRLLDVPADYPAAQKEGIDKAFVGLPLQDHHSDDPVVPESVRRGNGKHERVRIFHNGSELSLRVPSRRQIHLVGLLGQLGNPWNREITGRFNVDAHLQAG